MFSRRLRSSCSILVAPPRSFAANRRTSVAFPVPSGPVSNMVCGMRAAESMCSGVAATAELPQKFSNEPIRIHISTLLVHQPCLGPKWVKEQVHMREQSRLRVFEDQAELTIEIGPVRDWFRLSRDLAGPLVFLALSVQ